MINLKNVCYIFWVVWIKKHKIRLPNLKNVCYIFGVFDIFPKKKTSYW